NVTLQRSLDSPFGATGVPLFDAVRGDGFTHHRLMEYYRLPFFLFGGISVFSLRMQCVVLGLIEIAIVYAIGREMFSRRVAIVAAYIKDPSLFLYKTSLTSWLSDCIAAYQASGKIAALLPIWTHLELSLLGFNLIGSVDNHYLPGRGDFLVLPAALLFAGVTL